MSLSETRKEPFDRFRTLIAAVWPARSEQIKHRLTASYQPMLEFMLLPAAVYFAFMTGLYMVLEEMPGLLLLAGISATTCLACLAIRHDIAGRMLTFHGLEARGTALFVLVFAGLVAEQLHRFQPEKLPLFMFLMLVTSTASVSIRIAVSAIALCMATAFLFAGQAGADMRLDILLIALGCSLVAFSMTAMTRMAITKEIRARVTAEELRKDAEHAAHHDPLTELPNRRVFLQALGARFKKRSGPIPAFAIAMVDLDGFKKINDTFGHAAGDAVVLETAARLTSHCGADRLVARLGGDKFGILIENVATEDNLAAFGSEIRAALAQTYEVLGIRLSVNASIGLVPEQIGIFTASEMFERADFAMSRARTEKQGVTVFSEGLERERRNDSAVEHNLRYGDRDREMHVVFQPQIDFGTGKTAGFEALARWNNPELGFVPPDVFIAAAERIGVIEELTALFLTKALRVAREWPETIGLSFNLSIRDILSQDSIDTVCRIVRESGVDAGRIEFEVTENLIISDFSQAEKSVRQLHARGARVALDDFGVGYANFGHIDRLNINTIKIDRSFVTRLGDSSNSGKIVKTMIDMCANLEADCVVEGVETGEELAVLKSLGARYIQGYLFGRPMEPDRIPAFLAGELAGLVSEAAARPAKTG